jgi:hypothetical protein
MLTGPGRHFEIPTTGLTVKMLQCVCGGGFILGGTSRMLYIV